MTTSLEESIPTCILDMKVEQQESSLAATAHCIFPHTFCGFDGHFPENPVLPAIVQLATVRHIAERLLLKPLKVKSYSKTKFRAMIQPDQLTIFQLTLTPEDNTYHSKFKITDREGKAIANGLCLYRDWE